MSRGDAFFSGVAGFMVAAVIAFILAMFIKGVYNAGYDDAIYCKQFNLHCR